MSELRFRNITCIPCFHNRLQFAREVRRVFQEFLPDVVAVELPDIYTSDLLSAVDRLPRLSLLCIHQAQGSYHYIPVFPHDALIEGIRLARENHLPLALIDLAIKNYAPDPHPFAPPDDEAIPHLGLEVYYQQVLPWLPATQAGTPDRQREEHMAARLHHLSNQYERVLFVCGMIHWEPIKALLAAQKYKAHAHQLEGVNAPFLAKVAPNATQVLLEEIPWLVWHYELSRRFGLEYQRTTLIHQLLLEAREAPALAQEGFSLRDVQNVVRYATKLALTDKRLSPDLYHLILACKQTLGDDYALEVLERALAYPYEDPDPLPEIQFDTADSSFSMGGRQITLQRRLSSPLTQSSGKDWRALRIVRKRQEALPPGYMPLWFFFGFYSHIPEDLILEGFIERLGDKLASQAQAQEIRIQEFQGSLLDGIDMRETIRHRPLGKIFVREERSRLVPIGAWILIFDENLSEQNYPWMMSLSAEHHNESDIAFYASHPALHPVSYDIIRGHYGALLALKPALPENQKLSWEALDVDEDQRKAQLIHLAIAHSSRPGILYLAAQPPAPHFFKRAAEQGKTIYYLPVTQVSQRHLKRIQRFHLLSRREVRKIADDFI